MATTDILPQECVEAFITRETEQLAAHLFATTFGLDWTGAWNRAIAELPDFLSNASAPPPIMQTLETDHAAA